jgi:glycosyltransferase involved in cell wall biosynthesis
MHILLIHQYFQETDDPGGMRWNAMAKLWVEQGHTITVIAGMTHYAKGTRNPKYNNKYVVVDDFAPGIKVIRTHVSRSYNNNFRGRMNAYFAFVFSGTIGGLLKAKDKYDCIIVSSPPLTVGVTALILKFFKRLPFVFEIRDLWPESAIDTGVLTNKTIIKFALLLERRLYKSASLINVLTPAMKNSLITKKGVAENKIIYFPNAADFELSEHLITNATTNSLRKELDLPTDKLIVCYVGAHGVANHLIQILDAAVLIKNEPIIFLLLGDGMQKATLQEIATQRNLSNVVFRPAVPKGEAMKYILASDIGMSILKKAETFKTVFSNKTFDYMACKKPIILGIDGVSRELLATADAGIYVEPENPEALANAAIHYLHNRELIFTHGENGYRFVKANFDRTILATNYIQTLSNFFDKKPVQSTVQKASTNVPQAD